ncbi:MAG TPA: DapH/DapD/GlmU-related protein [Sphingomicrobium sp.]|nr:DapH/DapD/GlmU-related protein [Sphingomicrobium sp.]
MSADKSAADSNIDDRRPHRPPISLRQRVQRFIQVRLWGMDIHPSAWIAATALIDRTWPRGVHIGPDCMFDEQSVLLTHDMTRGVYLDTSVGARTRVGPRAIILPGVKVGADCTIAAGALVNRDLPDGSLVIGNPARIVDPD